MKKALSVLAALILFSGLAVARAHADETCMNDCLQNNYDSKFCQEKCSDNPNPLGTQQTVRQVEPKCYQDCTTSGHDSAYCTKACMY
jgi:hypothetical protein